MDKLQIVDTKTENKLNSSEPQCMRERPVLDKTRTNLTNEQLTLAVPALVNKDYLELNFPKTQRIRVDPPVEGQKFGVICFTPSKTAVPDKDGVFGVLKVRGCYETDEKAEERCVELITNVDSYNENYIISVGNDFPICTDNDKYCKTTKEVDIRSKLDSVTKEKIVDERKKEEKEKQEIQQRHKQLLSDVKTEQTFNDLDYYVSLRVKKAQARQMQEEYEMKLKQLSKKIKQTNQEIWKLDEQFPKYQGQYELKYKEAIDSIGGDHNNKMIQYMK